MNHVVSNIQSVKEQLLGLFNATRISSSGGGRNIGTSVQVSPSSWIGGTSSSSLTQLLIFIVSILTGGFRYYQYYRKQTRPQQLLVESKSLTKNDSTTTTSIQQIRKVSSTTPYFGERPHYFMPPSDMEQYRKSSSTLSSNRSEHYHIPYPNDPPHTFPSIKARNLFTKSPKKLSQVYIERIDPVNRANLRTGAKLKVPLQQLEERFRSVYSNANDNGLEITINSKNDKPFEKLGYFKNDHVYDFHNTDALISPPLYK